MALHAELPSAPARAELVRTTSCPQCGQELPAPERSEHLRDRGVRSFWSCKKCGCQIEALVYRPSKRHCCF
jgi:uncharacterized protein with PIN domain